MKFRMKAIQLRNDPRNVAEGTIRVPEIRLSEQVEILIGGEDENPGSFC